MAAETCTCATVRFGMSDACKHAAVDSCTAFLLVRFSGLRRPVIPHRESLAHAHTRVRVNAVQRSRTRVYSGSTTHIKSRARARYRRLAACAAYAQRCTMEAALMPITALTCLQWTWLITTQHGSARLSSHERCLPTSKYIRMCQHQWCSARLIEAGQPALDQNCQLVKRGRFYQLPCEPALPARLAPLGMREATWFSYVPVPFAPCFVVFVQ